MNMNVHLSCITNLKISLQEFISHYFDIEKERKYETGWKLFE